MNWSTGQILSWSDKCAVTCCSPDSTPLEPQSDRTLAALSSVPHVTPGLSDEEFPDQHSISNILPCYLDLKEVFNKAKATSLPPHCPYDCAIEIHRRGTGSRYHMTLFIPSWSRLLLRGQERQIPLSLHRLPWTGPLSPSFLLLLNC